MLQSLIFLTPNATLLSPYVLFNQKYFMHFLFLCILHVQINILHRHLVLIQYYNQVYNQKVTLNGYFCCVLLHSSLFQHFLLNHIIVLQTTQSLKRFLTSRLCKPEFVASFVFCISHPFSINHRNNTAPIASQRARQSTGAINRQHYRLIQLRHKLLFPPQHRYLRWQRQYLRGFR